MEANLVNLSFYRFFQIERLLELRVELKVFCNQLGLKGTILLAPEGINVAVSGLRAPVERFKKYAIEKLGIQEDSFKECSETTSSFKRMLVKIKKEIITVGDSLIRPDQLTGKRLPPGKLKQWLDEGRSIILLDTRNQYEIQVGTFRGALHLSMEASREFKKKASSFVESCKDKTVVTFCTGGIRCEKASAVLLMLGIQDVYQLEGGILRYFRENGAAHFDGNCFVFDWRLAVDDELNPVGRSSHLDVEFGRHKL